MSSWREAIRDAQSKVGSAADQLHDAVSQARAEGASWAEIGKEMGVSRQAAQQRFKDGE